MFTAGAHLLLSVITAPLLTINTSMQLSMPNNAVTMLEFKRQNQVSRSFQARMGSIGIDKPVDSSFRFGFMPGKADAGASKA